MDINKIMLMILLTPLVIFGLFFLSWFGLDKWESWKARRKMRSKHIHHIVLSCWPLLSIYIGIRFGENLPFLVGLIFVILTTALYFFSSLWDVRYESIHGYIQSESSYLLYRMAKSYPLIIMSLSCIAMLIGIGLLIITLLNLSGEIRSLIAFFTFGCIYLTLYLLFYKKIPSWEKRTSQ